MPDSGATSPRTSLGYTATFALLHVSMVAVNSASVSGFLGNPDVRNTRLFRPGTVPSPLATLRSASNTLRIPNSASALPSDGIPNDATSTGSLGDVQENFTSATTFLS